MGSKKAGVVFAALAVLLLAVAGFAFYAAARGQNPPTAQKAQEAPAAPVPPGGTSSSPDSLSLITEPDDGTAPLERLIGSASSSIDLVMYELEDSAIEQLLAARAAAGVSVRVILDDGYFGGGSSANEAAFDYLHTHGVSVRWSPEYFALTHEKSLVIDSREALIMTFNLSPQYYKTDRDFGVVDTDLSDVGAIEQAFDSDWHGWHLDTENSDDLVWSPGARDALLALIGSARKSLDVYNEEMDDPQITAALAAAAKRGVSVRVDMTYQSDWKQAFQTLVGAGAQVRTYAASAPRYIHAKVIIADNSRAFVGSENFSPTSLDQNRELGIIFSDSAIVASLSKTFASDWTAARPFSGT